MNTAYEQTFENHSAAQATPEERASFIRKTYLHVAGAILLFILMEAFIIGSGAGLPLAQTMLGGRFSWLIVLGAFMGVSMLANWWANSQTSKGLQYMGLLLFTVAEAVLFTPLLFFAEYKVGSSVILEAGIVALGLFMGLTAIVFLTRRDFSFLGPILSVACCATLAYIVAGLLFGFTFGTFFSWIMVTIAGGCILYDTSNILHRYRPEQHVAAALALFASIALLFWYVLRIFMGSRN
jgi:FtsH-binding integral membrane protein